ncbi:cold shock protein domain containing protein [Rhodotorula toruloides]|uniref:Cold shock protein domain containing protein n=1 Tax=Rhodotorula toruloides TaxID=5286 RepID=A0A511KP03_RHOTO|nr:cold shock protein domain containing protein [Rhodotorula toruloides]
MSSNSGALADDSSPPPYSSLSSQSSEGAQPPEVRRAASSARLPRPAYADSDDPHSSTNSAPSLAHPHTPSQYLYSYSTSGSYPAQAPFEAHHYANYGRSTASAYPYSTVPTPSTSASAYYSNEYPITHSPSPPVALAIGTTPTSPASPLVSLSPAMPLAFTPLDAGLAALSLTHSPQGSPSEAYHHHSLPMHLAASPDVAHYAHHQAYPASYPYSAPSHPQQGFYYPPPHTQVHAQSPTPSYAPNGFTAAYPYGFSSLPPPPSHSPDVARPRTRGGCMPPLGAPRMAATNSHDSNVESKWSLFRRSIEEGEHPMSRGTCKFFNPGIGFGYIVDDRAEELGTDVFVHYTGIDLPRGFRCLSQGERVEYVLTKNVRKNRIQALRVTGENGMPLIGLTGNPQHVRTIQRTRRGPSNGDLASFSD